VQWKEHEHPQNKVVGTIVLVERGQKSVSIALSPYQDLEEQGPPISKEDEPRSARGVLWELRGASESLANSVSQNTSVSHGYSYT